MLSREHTRNYAAQQKLCNIVSRVLSALTSNFNLQQDKLKKLNFHSAFIWQAALQRSINR